VTSLTTNSEMPKCGEIWLVIRHCHFNWNSIRSQGYDYTNAGIYFVTIYSHQRQHLFGEIDNRYCYSPYFLYQPFTQDQPRNNRWCCRLLRNLSISRL